MYVSGAEIREMYCVGLFRNWGFGGNLSHQQGAGAELWKMFQKCRFQHFCQCFANFFANFSVRVSCDDGISLIEVDRALAIHFYSAENEKIVGLTVQL